MDKTLLLVIDVQKNFINKNTEFLIKKISNLLESEKFNLIAFTKFVNDENSPFYKTLNWRGCLKESDKKIMIDTKNNKVLEKRTYTAFNDELKQFMDKNNIGIIYLCGIDTDACVMKTALDLFDNKYDVKVIEDCSMSHSGIENHKMAIHILKKLIGKENVIKFDDNLL